MTRETAGSRPAARYLDGPVAIIGAGIGGLTAALSLQHFGVPVRAFEQAQAFREVGAGVTITPNAMNALNFLGIGPALAEQAGETLQYFVRSAADSRELEQGRQNLRSRRTGRRTICAQVSGPVSQVPAYTSLNLLNPTQPGRRHES